MSINKILEKYNVGDLSNVSTNVKTGCSFEDLSAQSDFIKKSSDGIIGEICNTVISINEGEKEGLTELTIDSIYHYIFNLIEMCKELCDKDEYIVYNSHEIAAEVYRRCELAKGLLRLTLEVRKLEELEDKIELTRNGVLL